ncbi:MAG: response regulator transcription factor [Gammaproteobacteria bacterium]
MTKQSITQREREVLMYLARGKPNKFIARELGISPFTVRDHVTCLLRKMGVSSRVELGIFADRTYTEIQ